MPKTDERMTQSGARKQQESGRGVGRAYALLSRAHGRRLFIVLAIALATVLMNIPVKTVAQQQDDGSSNGSALTVNAPNIEPTEADLAAGVVLSRLDTRQVGVKGLPAAEYDLVLQTDGEGKFHLHAIEVGSKTVYADVVTPELVDTPAGKELNIDLPGDGDGQDLRIPVRICVTVTVTVTIGGIRVPLSATVCVTINIGR